MLEEVSTFVLTSFASFFMIFKLADFRVCVWLCVILFLMDECVLLLLFHGLFVVVVLLVNMVTIWCLGNAWLFVEERCAVRSLGANAFVCVDYVVIMVENVVTCCRCDDVVHGGIYGDVGRGGREQEDARWWLCCCFGCHVYYVDVVLMLLMC